MTVTLINKKCSCVALIYFFTDVHMSISPVVGSVNEGSGMVQVCVTLSAIEAIERNVNIMLISNDDTGIIPFKFDVAN